MLRLLDYVGLGDLVKGRFRIGQENSPWFEKKSKIGHGGFWFSKKNQKNPFLLITKTFLNVSIVVLFSLSLPAQANAGDSEVEFEKRKELILQPLLPPVFEWFDRFDRPIDDHKYDQNCPIWTVKLFNGLINPFEIRGPDSSLPLPEPSPPDTNASQEPLSRDSLKLDTFPQGSSEYEIEDLDKGAISPEEERELYKGLAQKRKIFSNKLQRRKDMIKEEQKSKKVKRIHPPHLIFFMYPKWFFITAGILRTIAFHFIHLYTGFYMLWLLFKSFARTDFLWHNPAMRLLDLIVLPLLRTSSLYLPFTGANGIAAQVFLVLMATAATFIRLFVWIIYDTEFDCELREKLYETYKSEGKLSFITDQVDIRGYEHFEAYLRGRSDIEAEKQAKLLEVLPERLNPLLITDDTPLLRRIYPDVNYSGVENLYRNYLVAKDKREFEIAFQKINRFLDITEVRAPKIQAPKLNLNVRLPDPFLKKIEQIWESKFSVEVVRPKLDSLLTWVLKEGDYWYRQLRFKIEEIADDLQDTVLPIWYDYTKKAAQITIEKTKDAFIVGKKIAIKSKEIAIKSTNRVIDEKDKIDDSKDAIHTQYTDILYRIPGRIKSQQDYLIYKFNSFFNPELRLTKIKIRNNYYTTEELRANLYNGKIGEPEIVAIKPTNVEIEEFLPGGKFSLFDKNNNSLMHQWPIEEYTVDIGWWETFPFWPHCRILEYPEFLEYINRVGTAIVKYPELTQWWEKQDPGKVVEWGGYVFYSAVNSWPKLHEKFDGNYPIPPPLPHEMESLWLN